MLRLAAELAKVPSLKTENPVPHQRQFGRGDICGKRHHHASHALRQSVRHYAVFVGVHTLVCSSLLEFMLEHPLPGPKQGQEEDTLKCELQQIAILRQSERPVEERSAVTAC